MLDGVDYSMLLVEHCGREGEKKLMWHDRYRLGGWSTIGTYHRMVPTGAVSLTYWSIPPRVRSVPLHDVMWQPKQP
jgi:hypothetical protein